MGRKNDPLKGVSYLERAVSEVNYQAMSMLPCCPDSGVIDLRIVSNAQGEELAKEWDWCDVLCLPTLSENFGRVVAEAIERGRSVITTDGAPAWREYFKTHPEKGIYLAGFRNGDDSLRVQLLADALKYFVG